VDGAKKISRPRVEPGASAVDKCPVYRWAAWQALMLPLHHRDLVRSRYFHTFLVKFKSSPRLFTLASRSRRPRTPHPACVRARARPPVRFRPLSVVTMTPTASPYTNFLLNYVSFPPGPLAVCRPVAAQPSSAASRRRAPRSSAINPHAATPLPAHGQRGPGVSRHCRLFPGGHAV